MKHSDLYPVKLLSFSFFLLLLFSGFISAQTVLTGRVIDEQGQSLAYANVFIENSYTGVACDSSGYFQMKLSEDEFPVNLVISYVGFKTKHLLLDGPEKDLTIVLTEGVDLHDEVVVSASRKREMVREAPAAVSVINHRKLWLDAGSEPILSLKNLVGVDIAQYGVASGHINLRGKSEVFQTETFVIADYRNIVNPSLGTMFFGQHPIDNLDLERIEVIKGPGSAMYGPGVEGGIVHFISKDPFRYPGTSLSLAAGNRSQINASFRHASILNDKWAYKLTGLFRSAHDFELDPNDPVHAQRMAGFITPIRSAITDEIIEAEVPNYDQQAIGFQADLVYKPNSKTTINTVAGVGEYRGLFRTSQGEGYVITARPYAQLRVNSGKFFGQVFWSFFRGKDGNSYLYNTGRTTFNRSHQIETQLQYNIELLDNKLDLTIGGDNRFITIDTKGTINGRFEDEDDYTITGVYLQSEYKVTDKLDLIAAGRVDRFSILDETAFSPRLGLVYNYNPSHSFRLTWNRAFGAPTSLNLFADTPIANTGAFLIYLVNGIEELTFDERNGYNFLTSTRTDNGDIPLSTLHAISTQILSDSGQLPPDLSSYLFSLLPAISGSTASVTTSEPLNRPPLSLSQSNMYELGYKGVLGDKWAVTLDVYYNQRKNILSAPIAVSPFLLYPFAGGDLSAELVSLIDPDVAANYGFTPEVLAGIYQGVIESITLDENGAPTTLGVLSTDNSPDELVTLDYAYFNFEELDYWGVDFGLEYYLNNDLSFFGNISWISQSYWEELKLNDLGQSRPLSLNVPDTRIKAGFYYTPGQGFFGNAAIRYTDDWQSVNGLSFSGPVEGYTIVDASIGYHINENIALSFSSSNIFDVKYRAIFGAPDIRRLFLVRAVMEL